MKNSVNAILLSAALSGLIGGTTVSVAQTAAPANHNGVTSTAKVVKAGYSYGDDKADKHSCKGKNDCKGKGGCKTGDNGCKAKNSCKGKGGCATDGSKPPKAI